MRKITRLRARFGDPQRQVGEFAPQPYPRAVFRRALCPAFLGALVSACAPAIPIAPPPIAKKAPAPLEKPRWYVMDTHGFVSRARVATSDGSFLHAGVGGERWLESQEGARVVSEHLVPETISGILPKSDGFVFLGASGTLWHAAEPLGPVRSIGKIALPAQHAAAGKSAIVAIDDARRVHRSVDGGATFTEAKADLGKHVVQGVVMSADGRGLILAHPQKVLVTTDDGATWTPIAGAHSIGPLAVRLSYDGTPAIDGVRGTALLSNDAHWLSSTIDDTPEWMRKKSSDAPSRPFDTTWASLYDSAFVRDEWMAARVVAGNRVELGRAPLGKLPVLHDEPMLAGCRYVRIAADGDFVVAACRRQKTTGVHELALFESTDAGATFTVAGTLPSDQYDSIVDLRVHGPGVIALGGSNLQPRVRMAAGREPVLLPVTSSGNVVSSALDPAKGLYVAVSAGASEPEVIFVPRDGGPVERRGKLPYGRIALAFVEGALVAISGSPSSPMRVLASVDGGFTFKERATIDSTDSFAIAGAHAIAVAGDRTYESLDAGATWNRVVAPSMGAVWFCGAHGCRFTRGFLAAPSAEATNEKPSAKAAAVDPKAIAPVRCKVTGPAIAIGDAFAPSMASLDRGAIRTALPFRAKDGSLRVRVRRDKGEGTVDATLDLLGPDPKDPKLVVAGEIWTVDGGVIALRRVRSADPKKLTDVEMAWWSWTTDKVVRAAKKGIVTKAFEDNRKQRFRLRPYPPFWPETARIEKGGAHFRFADKEPLWFFADGGKQESISVPDAPAWMGGVPSIEPRRSTLGDTTFLTATYVDSRRPGVVAAAFPPIAPSTEWSWSLRVFDVGPQSWVHLENGAHVFDAPDASATWLAPVNPLQDARALPYLDMPKVAATSCTPASDAIRLGRGAHAHRQDVVVEGDGPTRSLPLGAGVVHLAKDGSMCTRAFMTSGGAMPHEPQEVALVDALDLQHSQLVQVKMSTDGLDTDVLPIACTP